MRAKLSSISEQPYATFISAEAYSKMNKEVRVSSDGRNMWESRNFRENMVYRSSWYWHVPS